MKRSVGGYMQRRGMSPATNAAPASAVANDAVAMDVFRNVAGRMGYGTPSVAEAAEYELNRYTNDYWLMVTLFRNHWLARKICERPAQDMCRAWPRLQCELDPKLIAKFNRKIQRTYIPQKFEESLTWAALFGGAGALMVIEGHENILDQPLDLDDVGLDSFKGLIVFDRWCGITPTGQVANDIESPIDYGKPEFYRVNGIDGGSFDIHHSRVLRFCGPRVPQPEYQASLYWGISRLEIVYEEVRKCDNIDWSILNLMFRAQILTQVNPELANLLSGAAASQQAMLQFFRTMQAQNELLSNQSMLVLPKDGKLESHQYSFGGVAEIMAQKQMYLAGAADMPVSLLFGRTVTGLGQTGDPDMRAYEQRIGQNQQSDMRPALDKLYPVICMSEFGEVPEDLDMMFPPVRVLTEEEKAELASKAGTYINETYTTGIISQKIAAKEHKALGEVTEIMTNITDEFLETLDEEVNVPLEIETAEARAGSEEFEDEGAEGVQPSKAAQPGKKAGKGKDAALGTFHKVAGLDVVIETPKGTVRRGKDFEVTMPADYGFIPGVEGADGDELDCYVGDGPGNGWVYVVDQSKLGSKKFDEHKCMINFNSMTEAMDAFKRGHHRATDVFMDITPMPMSDFKRWTATHNMKKPASA